MHFTLDGLLKANFDSQKLLTFMIPFEQAKDSVGSEPFIPQANWNYSSNSSQVHAQYNDKFLNIIPINCFNQLLQ